MAKPFATPGLGRFSTALAAALCVVLAAFSSAAEKEALPRPRGTILLTIEGKILRTNQGDKAVFDREMLEQLRPARLRTRTVVTDGVKRFDGFYMRDLLDLVGAEGKTVFAGALNDYMIDIPSEDFSRFEVIVATHMDGEELEARDKGPLWIVYPRDDHPELQDLRYDYRWVWQLDRLEIR